MIKDVIRVHEHALVVLSEGVPTIPNLADDIPRLTGIRLRYVRLGHAQRGGKASHRDRVLAHAMADMAYQALKDGVRVGVMLVREGRLQLYDGQISEFDLVPPDYTRYATINGLPLD